LLSSWRKRRGGCGVVEGQGFGFRTAPNPKLPLFNLKPWTNYWTFLNLSFSYL
jgi:hypothetical protein